MPERFAWGTWTQRSLIGRDSHLNRISRGPSGTLYLAGEHGTALRSTDEGATWIQLPPPTTSTLYGILPLDDHTLLAYGGSMTGQIYRSDDNGQSWSALHLARKILLKTGLITHDGAILLAGVSGDWRDDGFHGFFKSRDGGHSFVPWPLAPKLASTSPDWSTKLALDELLQAPDGSFMIFGPAGATTLGR